MKNYLLANDTELCKRLIYDLSCLIKLEDILSGKITKVNNKSDAAEHALVAVLGYYVREHGMTKPQTMNILNFLDKLTYHSRIIFFRLALSGNNRKQISDNLNCFKEKTTKIMDSIFNKALT